MKKLIVISLTAVLFAGFSSLAYSCLTDAECDDGLFCNGTETCDIGTGSCVAVSACPPAINGCVTYGHSCDEINDQCLNFQDDSLCLAGEFCAANGDCLPFIAEANDTCKEGNSGTDVDYFRIECNNGICDVLVNMCDDLSHKAKYRVHFDTAEDFFYLPNPDCFTTSDDTAMYRPRREKLTGPEELWFDIHDFPENDELHWIFLYEDLGIVPGAYLATWVDVHKKGIRDRAPDTNADDGCAKPQVIGEALEIWAGTSE